MLRLLLILCLADHILMWLTLSSKITDNASCGESHFKLPEEQCDWILFIPLILLRRFLFWDKQLFTLINQTNLSNQNYLSIYVKCSKVKIFFFLFFLYLMVLENVLIVYFSNMGLDNFIKKHLKKFKSRCIFVVPVNIFVIFFIHYVHYDLAF